MDPKLKMGSAEAGRLDEDCMTVSRAKIKLTAEEKKMTLPPLTNFLSSIEVVERRIATSLAQKILPGKEGVEVNNSARDLTDSSHHSTK